MQHCRPAPAGRDTGGSPPSCSDRCPCGRWIRAVRDPAHVEWLRTQGVVWLARVDLDVINNLVPQATRLDDALTALAAAALALRSRVVPHVSPWTLVGQITHGRLVARPVPARPG